MGLKSSRRSRLQAAIAAWRQKMIDERQAAIDAANAARALSEENEAKDKSEKYKNEAVTYAAQIDSLVADINTHITLINTKTTEIDAATTSADADTIRGEIVELNKEIVNLLDDLSTQRSMITVSNENASKFAGSYTSTAGFKSDSQEEYDDAITAIATVSGARLTGDNAVSNAIKKVTDLKSAEEAAAALAAATAAREAAELAEAESKTAANKNDVVMYAGSIDTLVANILAKVTEITTKSAEVDAATTSSAADTLRSDVVSLNKELVEYLDDLSTHKAQISAAQSNVLKYAGTYESTQADKTTSTTEYNDALTAIDTTSGARLTGDNAMAAAIKKVTDLRSDEAAAAAQAAAEAKAAEAKAAADAAAAQAIAEAAAAQSAAQTYANAQIAAIADSAPATLDTLNELAAALGDDPNFATTVTNTLATKLTADITTNAPTTGQTVVWNGTTFVPGDSFSQSDFDTAFAAKGVMGHKSQASAPSSPTVGDEWYDTDNGRYYKFIDDGATTQWVEWDHGASLNGSESFSANVAPSTDNAYKLGSTSKRFTEVHAVSFKGNLNGNVTGNVTGNLTGTATNAGQLDNLDSTQFVRSDANDTITGHIQIVNDTGLFVGSSTNGVGATIKFSDNTGFGQQGSLKYLHADGAVTTTGGNSNDGWIFSGTEARTVVKVEGDIEATGTMYGTATSAQYADLAEKYVADKDYEPGTVLILGGDQEVTTTSQYGDTRIAGVVSTNPAYLMNSELDGVEIALMGRVPCKVMGKCKKGDLLVSSSMEGYAESWKMGMPNHGSVIGKAIENKDTEGEGVIEVLVGR